MSFLVQYVDSFLTTKKKIIVEWLSGKSPPAMQETCRGCRFNLWAGKTLWRKKWQPIPVCLPGKFPWTEEPGGL